MKQLSTAAAAALLWTQHAWAIVPTYPPQPAVTQAPALFGRDASVYGWYSAGFTDGSTICELEQLNDSRMMVLTLRARERSNGGPSNLHHVLDGELVRLLYAQVELYIVRRLFVWLHDLCLDEVNLLVSIFQFNFGLLKLIDFAP
jgi:hypothetical protein